jgi:hypothetical protein
VIMSLPHVVVIVRNEGTPQEVRITNVRANIQSGKSFFAGDADIHKGDLICTELCDEKQVVKKVDRIADFDGSVDHIKAVLVDYSDWVKANAPEVKPYATQQNFYGEVSGKVAGHDVNDYSGIDMSALLQAISEKITSEQELPVSERRTLLAHIGEIVRNPYISGIAVSALMEVAKHGLHI